MQHEYNGMPNYGKQKRMVGEGTPQTPAFFSKLFIEVIHNTLRLYYCSCQGWAVDSSRVSQKLDQKET